MSELLRRWLREDVGLMSPVENFEQDFASGYAFGELLYRMQLQPDFSYFIDKTHPDAMINNFTRLQPTLSKLGIPCDTKTANSIMTEEKGAAGRLVYLLKSTMEGLSKDLEQSKLTGSFAKSLTVATKPSLAVVDTRGSKTIRQQYDNTMHKIFEDNVRVNAKNPNKLMESLHLKKFVDEQDRQSNLAHTLDMNDLEMSRARRDGHRLERLNLMKTQRDDKTTKTNETIKLHKASRAAARSLEKGELRVELALKDKAERKIKEANATAGSEALVGIDAFEKNLRRMGSDDSSKTIEILDRGELPPVGATPLEHLQKIKGQLPPPQTMAQDAKAYMSRLKSKKGEEVTARKERERRRRKVLLEQERNQQAGEERRREEALLSTLQRQSKEEQRLAERLWQLKQEKEVMRENRTFREKTYSERREQDYNEALAREAELARSMKEEYTETAALEEQRWRDAEAARQEQKRVERVQLVTEMVHELVALGIRCAEYRERTDALVPRKEYREWVSLFVRGVPLSPPLLEDTTPPPEPDDAAMVLDQSTVTDYLACEGEWELPDSIGTNMPLGVVVQDLMKITVSDPAPPQLPDLDFPVKMALIGAPFSGKSTVARKLAEKQGVKLLDPEQLVLEAVAEVEEVDKKLEEEAAAAAAEAEAAAAEAAANAPAEEAAPAPEAEAAPPAEGEEASTEVFTAPPETETPKEPARVIPPREALGREAQESLKNGEDVSDDVVIKLIVQAIIDLKAKPVVEETEEGSTPAPPAPPAEGEEEEKPKGFLIDGFPRTSEQAVKLEKALTGLDLDQVREMKSKASVLAPPPSDEVDPYSSLVSGLDKVIVMDVTDETGIKRAVGRRIDPQTKVIYHLEFDPPPTNDAGLMERLEEAAGLYNDTAQAQARLTASTSERPAFDQWLTKFIDLVTPVPSEGPPDEVLASVDKVVEDVLAAKVAAHETQLASEAAARAKASALKASEAAAAAKADAQAAAQQLLVAKKAEVEAEALLNESPEDPGATELLNQKASEEVAAQLLKAKESMKAAETSSKEASEAAEQAAAAIEKAKEMASQADAAIEAKMSAEEAEKVAGEAGAAAEEAASAAKEAFTEAQAAVVKAEKAASGEQEEEATAEETTEGDAPAEEEGDEAAEELKVPEFVGVDKSLGSVLYSQWELIESSFMKGLKRAFYNLREERSVALGHFVDVKKNFLRFLRRADTKQQLLTTFQREYNSVDLDLRRKIEAKAEMLLRAEELRDTLWDVCDKKLEENEMERDRIMADTWVEDHTKLLAEQFVAIVQLEVDRHTASVEVMRDYYRAKCGHLLQPRNEEQLEAKNTSLVDIGGYTGATAAQTPETGAKKGGKETPGEDESASPSWLVPLAESVPTLHAALVAALAIIPAPPGEEGEEGADPKGKAKTPEPEAESEEEIAAKKQEKIVDMAGQDAYLREREILTLRLERLATRADVYIRELNDAAQVTKERLESWMAERYQAECSAVSAVIAVVRNAADAETELPHDLKLNGQEFVEDINIMALEPSAPPPPPPPAETPRNPGILSCKQLQLVASTFQAACPAGVMSVADASVILARVGAEEGGFGMPASWSSAPYERIRDTLEVLDERTTGHLDWREIFMSFVVASFPSLAAGTPPMIAKSAGDLMTADTDMDGLLSLDEFLGVKLWFETADVNDNAYDRGLELKKAIFKSMEVENSSKEKKLDYATAMLYLCSSGTLLEGCDKAFHCIGKGGTVSGEQLVKLAYPMGRAAGVGVGRAPYSGADIQDLMRKIVEAEGNKEDQTVVVSAADGAEQPVTELAKSAGGKTDATITAKQLLDHEEGNEFAKTQLSHYVLKTLKIT